MKKRHYPPSYLRYIQKRPTISLRIDEDLKNRLDAYRGKENLSYPKIIRKLLTEKEDNVKQWITIECPDCHQPMYFTENDGEIWNDVKTVLKRVGWRHRNCPAKKRFK